MTKKNQKAWFLNLVKFTAPVLTIFFIQLSQGVDLKTSGIVALYALYGAVADLFKKIK